MTPNDAHPMVPRHPEGGDEGGGDTTHLQPCEQPACEVDGGQSDARGEKGDTAGEIRARLSVARTHMAGAGFRGWEQGQ